MISYKDTDLSLYRFPRPPAPILDLISFLVSSRILLVERHPLRTYYKKLFIRLIFPKQNLFEALFKSQYSRLSSSKCSDATIR